MTTTATLPAAATKPEDAPAPAPPSPAQIDQLIAEYEAMQRTANETQAVADALEKNIVNIVRQHGSIPEGASQSWRLQGNHSTATVTIGTTKTLKDEQISALHSYMNEHNILHLFRRMFSTSTRYTLIDGARDVLTGVDIPQRTRDKVLALFGMCLEVKDKKPALKVTAVKPEKPARKPRAGKAAA